MGADLSRTCLRDPRKRSQWDSVDRRIPGQRPHPQFSAHHPQSAQTPRPTLVIATQRRQLPGQVGATRIDDPLRQLWLGNPCRVGFAQWGRAHASGESARWTAVVNRAAGVAVDTTKEFLEYEMIGEPSDTARYWDLAGCLDPVRRRWLLPVAQRETEYGRTRTRFRVLDWRRRRLTVASGGRDMFFRRFSRIATLVYRVSGVAEAGWKSRHLRHILRPRHSDTPRRQARAIGDGGDHA